MTAIKKMFFARTCDDKMFGSSKSSRVRYLNKDLIPNGTPKEIIEEISKHWYIDIKNIDWIRTYFSRVLCWPKCCFKRREKFLKLYNKGQDRIDAELDIVKIMKNLRNIKILMRNSFMDDEIKYQITHARKNLLNIDTSSESLEEETHHSNNHDHDGPALCASIKDMDPVKIRGKLTEAIMRKTTKRKKIQHLHFGIEF